MTVLPVRVVLLALYYGFARWLPASNNWVGRWARPLRRWICTPLFARAGRNVNVEARAFFGSGRQIEIGDNSSIGVAAQVYGPMTIGANVMMGPEVLVITLSHVVARTDIPMIDQGSTQPMAVVIENDVWIGQRVTLLPGVTVGTGAIVGTNAVVTRDVPPFAVVAGNPARVIRSRRLNDGKILDV